MSNGDNSKDKGTGKGKGSDSDKSIRTGVGKKQEGTKTTRDITPIKKK